VIEIHILDSVFRPVRDLANIMGGVPRGQRADSPFAGSRSDFVGAASGGGPQGVTVKLARKGE
jgi:hypothetical protein